MAKVLLVEDDNNLREIYEARLQAEGYTIVAAADGEEALVMAKAQKPDLVVADVMMPKISGFEMLDILRNTDGLKDVKVIMLTALGQSEDQKRADQMGADRYLVKSQVTLEDIVKATHELLGDKAAPAEPAASAAPKPEAAPAPAPAPSPAPAPVKADEPAPGTPPANPPAAEPPVADSPAAPPAAPPAEPAEPAEPAPASPPTPNPTPSSSKADGAAQSTVQEEADVEAKIEDFVAGATSEPTSPGATDDSKVQAAPADGTTKNTSSASDDKLMADAVETLVASTDKDESPKAETSGAAVPTPAPEQPAEAPKTTVIPVSSDPDVNPVNPPEPLDKDKAAPEKPEETKPPGNVSVSHTKVIKPLEGDSKKDINALLAEEEAQEAKAAETAPGATIVRSSSSAMNEAPASQDEDKPSGQPANSTPSASGTPEGSNPGSGGVAL